MLMDAFHVQMMGLRSMVLFDWVPSEANIGDWPTRPEKRGYIPAGAMFVKMELPTMDDFDGPIWRFAERAASFPQRG